MNCVLSRTALEMSSNTSIFQNVQVTCTNKTLSAHGHTHFKSESMLFVVTLKLHLNYKWHYILTNKCISHIFTLLFIYDYHYFYYCHYYYFEINILSIKLLRTHQTF